MALWATLSGKDSHNPLDNRKRRITKWHRQIPIGFNDSFSTVRTCTIFRPEAVGIVKKLGGEVRSYEPFNKRRQIGSGRPVRAILTSHAQAPFSGLCIHMSICQPWDFTAIDPERRNSNRIVCW
jgi:hypothetical protein